MVSTLQPNHPLRIFFISGLITIACLVGVGTWLGLDALFLTFVLILIEVTFSFDNAIINARILATMSRFWQQMFMTVGILIAVFGMRLVFPIVLVMATTGLGATNVVDLALHHPDQYAAQLTQAHPYIAAFGGMFLLMLCFAFFFDPGRKVLWVNIIERPLQKVGRWWVYTTISLTILGVITIAPWNHHAQETLVAGAIGVGLYLLLHILTSLFGEREITSSPRKTTALAGFFAFLYLQVLDASFSFDGVIGAFAVTQDVILIAIGLGIGALWVRSLTLLMVRRNTLGVYRYLEHGAHYTIGVLAMVLLAGLFVDIPEVFAGVAGILIVGSSVVSSIAASRRSTSGKKQ